MPIDYNTIFNVGFDINSSTNEGDATALRKGWLKNYSIN